MHFIPVEPTEPPLETISLEFRVLYEGRYGPVKTERQRLDMVLRLMHMARIPIDVDQAQKYLNTLRYIKSTEIPF